MITLKTLQWDNCFSYGSGNSIDLSENNLTQLIGKNGAGKSSIPLILEEVLFNKNSKNIKKTQKTQKMSKNIKKTILKNKNKKQKNSKN